MWGQSPRRRARSETITVRPGLCRSPGPPPLHSLVFMPSATPYEIGGMEEILPSAISFTSFRAEAKDPLLGGEPEVALAIVQDAGDFGGQTVPGGNRPEPAIP